MTLATIAVIIVATAFAGALLYGMYELTSA